MHNIQNEFNKILRCESECVIFYLNGVLFLKIFIIFTKLFVVDTVIYNNSVYSNSVCYSAYFIFFLNNHSILNTIDFHPRFILNK